MLSHDEEEKVDYTKLEINSISDLLIEVDSIKRELYEQIESNKVVKLEVQKHKRQLRDMEAEMEATIQGYWEVLESQQTETSGDSFRVKQQLVDQQNANESLKIENDGLKEQLLVTSDENKTLMRKVESHEQVITRMNKKVQKYKNQNGVPHTQVQNLEVALDKAHKEIERLRSTASKLESNSFVDKKALQQLETEKSQLTSYLTRKEKDEKKYKKALKEKQKSEQLNATDDFSKVKEENEALISQKNLLLKFKETIGRELEKLKLDNEKKAKVLEEKELEIHNLKAESDQTVERLRSANTRLGQENIELETDNMQLQKEHRSIEKKFKRLSNADYMNPSYQMRSPDDL